MDERQERAQNTKTHCHNGDAEKDDEDDKDEQGRRQM